MFLNFQCICVIMKNVMTLFYEDRKTADFFLKKPKSFGQIRQKCLKEIFLATSLLTSEIIPKVPLVLTLNLPAGKSPKYYPE